MRTRGSACIEGNYLTLEIIAVGIHHRNMLAGRQPQHPRVANVIRGKPQRKHRILFSGNHLLLQEKPRKRHRNPLNRNIDKRLISCRKSGRDRISALRNPIKSRRIHPFCRRPTTGPHQQPRVSQVPQIGSKVGRAHFGARGKGLSAKMGRMGKPRRASSSAVRQDGGTKPS